MDANQIMDAIRVVDSKIDHLKNEVIHHFNNVESRLSNIEKAISRFAGPNTLAAVPEVTSFPAPPSISHSVPLPLPAVYGTLSASHDSFQPTLQSVSAPAGPNPVGSIQNAPFLPFAIEMIAWTYKKKHVFDKQECSVCGASTFSIDCFRQDHFRWCRVHQRPMLKPYTTCGKSYHGCVEVKWEQYANWETLVQSSYASGKLGDKGVDGLDEMLFPQALYPHRYNAQGRYTG